MWQRLWLVGLLVMGMVASVVAQPGVSVDYCTYLGGSQRDRVVTAAIGGQFLVLGGFTDTPDFPTTAGVWRPSFPGNAYGDAFVTIIDPVSHDLVASTFVGGQRSETVMSVCLDDHGNIYAGGRTTSDDLPATTHAFQHELVSYQGGFVISMYPDLEAVRWLTYVDTPCYDTYDDDRVYAILHTHDGYLYAAGYISMPQCVDWTRQLADTLGGGYLLKLNDDDGSMEWIANIGNMSVHSLDIFPSGDILLGGVTTGNVPVSEEAVQTEPKGLFDHCIMTLHDDGSFAWGTYLGSDGMDFQLSAKVLGPGRAGFCGMAWSPGYPVVGTDWGATNHGSYDLVVGVIADDGRRLDWCGYLGGSGTDGYDSGNGVGLTIDDGGHLYIFTSTESRDLPVTSDAYAPQPEEARLNGMMASLNAETGQLRWLSYFGSSDLTEGTDVAVYPNGMAVVGCVYRQEGGTVGLPVTDDALGDTLAGASDGFVALFDIDDIVPTLVQSGELTWQSGTAVLRWRLSGNTTDLQAEVVTGASVRPLPLSQAPDGTWTARDEQACTGEAGPRTYRLVQPGENRWTELWRQTVTPECAAAGRLHLAAKVAGSGLVRLTLESPAAGTARVALYDLAGRRVADLPARTVDGGAPVTWEWHGRGLGGERLAAGRYLARCRVGDRSTSTAVLLVR